jgi:ABC-2 type transport system permease protein
MRKYGIVFRIALSERLVYRADFFIATFLRFIPIITTILLWRAIYDGAELEEVGGLAYQQMVGYYLLIMVTRAFGSMPRLASDMALDIRDGGLRKYLLQPIDYLTYQVVLRSAHKVVYFVMATLPYALVFFLCRDYLPGWPDATAWPGIIATLVLTFLLGYTINACIGLLGFWFLEVASFVHIFMTAQYFLSGHMFPLSLLPDAVQPFIVYLPFAYETYYPTLILLQKLDGPEVARVLLMQTFWVLLLSTSMYFGWRRGLRRYAAYGG